MGGDAVMHVHVQPRAGKTEITGRHGNALRIRVQAPPVDGRATEAAREVLAAALRLPASRVVLVSGERSRLKRFRLTGLAAAEARARLEPWLDEPRPRREALQSGASQGPEPEGATDRGRRRRPETGTDRTEGS